VGLDLTAGNTADFQSGGMGVSLSTGIAELLVTRL
jgi:hypothetical protein